MSQPHDDQLVRRAMEAAAATPPAQPCLDAEVLGLYAERELSGDEHREVEAHVAGCARCQAVVAAVVRSAPAGVDERGGALDGALDTGGSTAPWWAGWRWLVPVTATATVAVVAVWIGRPAPERLGMEESRSAAVGLAPSPAEPSASSVEPAPPATTAAPSPQLADGIAGGTGANRSQERPSAARRSEAPAPSPASGADRPPLVELRQSDALAKAEAPSSADGRQRAEDTAALERPAPAARPTERARAVAGIVAPAPPPPPPPAAPAAVAPSAAPVPPPPVPIAPGAVPATPPPPAPVEEALTVRGVDDTAARDAARNAGAAAAATAAFTAQKSAGASMPVQLTGTVTYRTRQALPAGAVIDVRMLDVSRADAPAMLMGRVEIVTTGEQVPVPFTLPYDTSAIDARRRYTVQVTIAIDGQVRFRTTTAHPVVTHGAPTSKVDVVVDAVR